MNKLDRVKELIQEYADCRGELDINKVAAEIDDLYAKPGTRCRYELAIYCQEKNCRGCPIWAKESGYLAYVLSQI